MPFLDNTFDALFCINAVDHLSNEEHRKNAFIELFRVIKPGGRLFVSALSMEARGYAQQDIIEVHNGVDIYFHVFRMGELDYLVKETGNKILSSYTNENNWFLLAEKI